MPGLFVLGSTTEVDRSTLARYGLLAKASVCIGVANIRLKSSDFWMDHR